MSTALDFFGSSEDFLGSSLNFFTSLAAGSATAVDLLAFPGLVFFAVCIGTHTSLAFSMIAKTVAFDVGCVKIKFGQRSTRNLDSTVNRLCSRKHILIS